jgi:peptidoglycan glycosyltransferase
VLAEQRIHRGRILDREQNVLADVTVAANGEVSRRFLAPSAAPVLGYASLRYGTGGLEAAFDSHLRGDDGERSLDTLWRKIRHAPRQGQDIQITLDRDLQRLAQESLMGQRGALVLLDAHSGEVLAMASSPTFDPGRLDERWETLADDPAAPLLNRATQGLYQPGAALQTVVLAEALIRGEVEIDLAAPVIDAAQPVPIDGQRVGCAAEKSTPATWAEAYAAACPAPFASLGPRLDAAGLMSAFTRWRLTTPPPLEVPTEATEQPAMDELATAGPTLLRQEAMGQGTLTVSPLRMALVAAGVANKGRMPAPRLVLRTQAADGAWTPLPPPGDAVDVLPADLAARLANAWEQDEDGIAGQSALAVAGEGQKPHAWFLGSSPHGARPCAIAVLLEHAGDPASAASIGRTLLRQASER